jgi:predicted MFS family arabinose efflux permease
MNTFQQPSSEVAFTLITPKDCYQKTGVLQALSRSLISIGHPIIAAAIYGLAGLDAAIAVDMVTFLVAFLSLALFIKLPKVSRESTEGKGTLRLAREGLSYLKSKPMILYVILFMACVNLISSAFEATLPGYIKPNPLGGNYVLGIVSSCSGIAMILGSLIFTKMPKPKDRVRVIYLSMLFSIGTENFILAFSRSPVLWCIGQILGWIFVPVMSANQNVIMRNEIPVELQGRVYACRNTLQFFTIPIGLFLGGFLVDNICEPYMRDSSYALSFFFGSGKGSGAAVVLFILGVAGTVMCLVFGRILKKYSYSD